MRSAAEGAQGGVEKLGAGTLGQLAAVGHHHRERALLGDRVRGVRADEPRSLGTRFGQPGDEDEPSARSGIIVLKTVSFLNAKGLNISPETARS